MEALGWALIHFVWQGAAIAALAAAVMGFCRRPWVRYWVGVGALALMTAMPLVTFLLMDASVLRPPSPAARAALSIVGSFLRSMLPFLVQGWFVGVALLSLRFAGGFLLLEQKRRQQSTPPGARVLALCREVQQRLGVRRAIRYLECGWLPVPAAIGCIRPVIFFPAAALTGLSEMQLRAVIAHELAHVRRWDFLVNLFQILTETLLFYHPALWWLNKRIRAERELCCDEIAVSVAGDRIAYAHALVLMAKRGSASGLAMAATHGILSQRIFHILGRDGARPRIAGLAGSLLFLIASVAAGYALFAAAPGLEPHENTGTIASQRIASLAPVSGRLQRESLPATTTRNDDYGIPRRNRLAFIKTLRPSQVSSLSVPFLIASADLDSPPAPDVPAAGTMPPMRSVVAEKLDALAQADAEYPAPVLKLNASRSMDEWTSGEAMNYCKDFAAQTVMQGANRPITVDDGAKRRVAFFYWHCRLSNNNGVMWAYGGDWGEGPAYIAVGAASSDHPVNVAGSWAISFPSSQPSQAAMMTMQAGARSCAFSQSGNTISGSCTGRKGSSAVTGIIDGRQVRWAWKFPSDDGREEGELDFIGMVGPDGAITGQSIPIGDTFSHRPEVFMATPGPAQVASQK
jgi:beta-lactamase regulating signal transducer with metallopeptidase domain